MRSLPLIPACAAALVSVLVACGGDDGGTAEEQPAATTQLTPVERGAELVDANGCGSCHDGGVGPGWDGLYGSTVHLDDGTTVVADDEYLARAITDPGAEKVDGYSVAMPENNLGDGEVADIVAYLESLEDDTAGRTAP